MNKIKGGSDKMYELTQCMKCTCARCGHQWRTRTEDKPIICPSCKSPYWNTPRKETNKNDEND
jgi:predicted Zn-ribbon and HTH transcriptional regulator